MTIDLSTDYLGLRLDHPLIVSACPLTGSVASLTKMRTAGAAAAVLPSIFEEQIEHDELEVVRMLDFWALSSPESADYFPQLDNYNTGPAAYLDLIADAKRQLDMPIIASLNGHSLAGWIRYAGLIEKAGADALELNIYQVVQDQSRTSAAIDEHYVQLVQAIKREIKIPIAVKIGPYFSSLPNLAGNLARSGADGLVLFNRYLAPDIDLDNMRFAPALELSTPDELRLAIRWIAILRDGLDISLAATGGIHSSTDVVKALLVGADAIACASAVLSRGPQVLGEFREGLQQWMQEHDYKSLRQLCGSMSMLKCPNPEGLMRANYIQALTAYTPSL
ncbi:MAG: dihydroorotate dehydrogenase-like protein [Pirellulaceae bacterium]